MTEAESSRSIVRSPCSDWLPRESLVDDGAAQAALGVVVGRLDAVGDGEGPERRPALEQVVGEESVALRLGVPPYLKTINTLSSLLSQRSLHRTLARRRKGGERLQKSRICSR